MLPIHGMHEHAVGPRAEFPGSLLMATAALDRPTTECPAAAELAPRARASGCKVSVAKGALFWFVAACCVRGPMVARVEGILDHDQAVVSLMASDISELRRWPIFFDGQRYMGALEAYVAAAFVRLFGFTPSVVSLAPLLFCGLFVAGQYVLWNRWQGRVTGHLAALLALICAPMAAMWTFIPRGGYIEFMVWGLAVLGVYQRLARPEVSPPRRAGQFGWGLLLGLGFFINPLSIIVYATLALDWVFGRHGASIRAARDLDTRPLGRLLDRPVAPLVWCLLGVAVYLLLTFGCQVRLGEGASFVFFGGLAPKPIAVPLGIAVLVLTLVGLAYWTNAASRAFGLLVKHGAFALGLATSLLPFVLFQVRSRLGLEPAHASLPMWLRDPTTVWMNARDLGRALNPLIGCDARGAALMYERWPEQFPPARLPGLGELLHLLSPLVLMLVAVVVAHALWIERVSWREWFALRRSRPATPIMLATLGVVMACALYLVQATSPDGSSTRYLIPIWVFLPGLLAASITRMVKGRALFVAMLVAAWSAAQFNLWCDIDRRHPLRSLSEALDRENARVILTPQHIGLIVSELTQQRVGFLEYQPFWARVHGRFRARLRPNERLVCVAETINRGLPQEDLRARLKQLRAEAPDSTRLLQRVDGFEIWETDASPEEVAIEGRAAQATDH